MVLGEAEEVESATCRIPFALCVFVHGADLALAFRVEYGAAKNAVVELDAEHDDGAENRADGGGRRERERAGLHRVAHAEYHGAVQPNLRCRYLRLKPPHEG